MDLSQYSHPPTRSSRHGRDPDTQLLLKQTRNGELGCQCFKQHCSCATWCKVGVVVAAILAATIALLVILLRSSGSPMNTDQTNEQILQSNILGSQIAQHLQNLTSSAHMAGTPGNDVTASYVKQIMTDAGLTYKEHAYQVLLSYPSSREMLLFVNNTLTYNGSLIEPVLDSYDSAVVDPFLAYSASGDITAPLVYANYGSQDDWNWIIKQGINATGCIALVRYGQIFRGNKVSLAQAYGAVGIIIYSDSLDDGLLRNETAGVYPNGPWRPGGGVQRGSVWNGNGDPLTPGTPSLPDAPRITLDQAKQDLSLTYSTPLPGIPALPISWDDALPLLTAMNLTEGCTLPPSTWHGGANVSYCIGPFPHVQVRLNIKMDENITTITNIVGKIPGAVEPDRIIMLGNHRDAWTFGAVDPSSGTSCLLGLIQAFGVLLKTGWRPRRSIWFASWDAEEYALTGSTEFAEQYESLLDRRLLLYINVDEATAGFPLLNIQGMTSLQKFVLSVLHDIPAPEGSFAQTLYDLFINQQGLLPTITPAGMGTGSDYGPFMQHLGVPSLNLMFYGPSNDSSEGIYHSRYDTPHWINVWGDDNWHYSVALSSLWSLLALRMADATILPFTYTEYAQVFLLASQELAHRIASNNSTKLHAAMNYLTQSIQQLSTKSQSIDKYVQTNMNALIQDANKLRMINDRLGFAERALLYEPGIPGKEWYRHICWAASTTDLYGASAFGWVYDALVANNIDEAARAIGLSAFVIQQMAEDLDTNDLN